MNEIEVLWLVLLLLYLSDGLWWVRWNSCVLERRWPGCQWRFRRSPEWPSSHAGALIFLWPLPLATSFQLDPWPVSLSPEGFAVWASEAWTIKGRPRQTGFHGRWGDAEHVGARGAAVYIGDRLLLSASTDQIAGEIAETMEQLRVAVPEDREDIMQCSWMAATDLDQARTRVHEAVEEGRLLRWCGATLWLMMFVIAPFVLTQVGGAWVLLSLALGLFALVLFNVWHFTCQHAWALPGERWARFESALIMCINWPMAARAADVLSRHRLAGFHAVAVALALGPIVGGRDFVEHVIRDAAHPLDLEDLDELAREIVDWHSRCQQKQLDELLIRANFSIVDEHSEEGSFCPRCRAAFTRNLKECPDCPGVKLVMVEGGFSD